MVMLTFLFFDQKYSSWANLFREFKTDCYSEIWYLEQFEYVKFNGDGHFFCFRPEILFLGKFGPKKENC